MRLEQRVRELEQRLALLMREAARVPARQASPLSPRDAAWIGKADTAIATGASGTVSIWSGTPGSEVDTLVDITNCYNRSAAIALGGWVKVKFVHGYRYVEPFDPAASSITVAYFHLTTDRDPSSEQFTVVYDDHFPENNTAPELTGGTFTVWDSEFIYKRAITGCHGIAVYNDSQARWDVIFCQQQCITATAIVASESPGQPGMCEAGEILIDDFIGTSPSPFLVEPSPVPTTALNDFGHKGMAGDALQLIWDEWQEEWVVINVEKKEAKLVLLQTDGTSLKEVEAAVEYCENPVNTGVSFFYRGVTLAAINKGSSGSVSRYSPGTTTASGTTDTVANEYADVESGKKVGYIKNGSQLYMISAECGS